MKRGVVVLCLVMMLLLSVTVYSQIFLGTVDGFIFFANGSAANNSQVNVTVLGKSGAGSAGSDFSQGNGFYVVTNLNLAAGDTVTVNANNSIQFGVENGTVDAFFTAEVNVTMIAVPGVPTLQNIADTHNNTLTVFNWTSGVDPLALPTFDNWELIGVQSISNATPPINQTFLTHQSYTWRVQTCNSLGCSAFVTDTFLLNNSAPPSPTLEDEPDTNFTDALLNWTSGGADPDGDPTTFDLNFDGTLFTNVTPAFNVTGLSVGLHTWRVRECDPFTCSAFSTDTFNVTNDPPTQANITEIGDSLNDLITFRWVSGTDPGGDDVFDEFRMDFNGTFISNATSPLTFDLTGFIGEINWSVRTCDTKGACGAFDSETFIHFTCPPPDGLI